MGSVTDGEGNRKQLNVVTTTAVTSKAVPRRELAEDGQAKLVSNVGTFKKCHALGEEPYCIAL